MLSNYSMIPKTTLSAPMLYFLPSKVNGYLCISPGPLFFSNSLKKEEKSLLMLCNMQIERKWDGERRRERIVPVVFYFLCEVIGEIIWQMFRREMERLRDYGRVAKNLSIS